MRDNHFDSIPDRLLQIEREAQVTVPYPLLKSDENLTAGQALAIFRDQRLNTDDIFRAAVRRILTARGDRIETFVPLYLTNFCDSVCTMCNMRRGNRAMLRKYSGPNAIREQLDVILSTERISAVCLLTGEYASEKARLDNVFYVGWAAHEALAMGFQKVYIEIGSVTEQEINLLAEWVTLDQPVVLGLFQETYDRSSYKKYMGGLSRSNPKGNYDRRLRTPDSWLDAGFKEVDMGILLGLHDPALDMALLLDHASHLLRRGAQVSLSLPRVRVGGVVNVDGVPDEIFVRLAATVALAMPGCPLIITTRETEKMIHRLLPITGIISPGSSDVLPYAPEGDIPNDPRTSQFFVAERRPRPSQVLRRIVEKGRTIHCFAHNGGPSQLSHNG